MAQIALFDSGLLSFAPAANQINAKSNSPNQDFNEVFGQAKDNITTKKQENAVSESSPKKDLPKDVDDPPEKANEVVVNEKPATEEKNQAVIKDEKAISEKPEKITKEEDSAALDDEVLKQIQETLAKIMMILEQMIGQEDTDIQSMLTEMDLSISDFLSTDTKDLILQLTGEEDVSLITNEELLNTVTEVTDKINELLQGLTKATDKPLGELDLLLKEFVATDKNTKNTEIPFEIETNEMVLDTSISNPEIEIETDQITGAFEDKALASKTDTSIDTDEPQIIIEDNTTKPETVETKTDTKVAKANDDESEEVTKENIQEVENTDSTYKTDDNTQKDSDEPKDNKKDRHFNTEVQNEMTAQKPNNTSEEITLEKTETFEYVSKEEQESILKQVQDNLKLIKQNDETTMEFMLHPQSLGTVKIAMTTRGGSITAQISAQNESVKQALETQVTQLRNNLEEQGIKVEAIEISIESHNLERNLDQHGENKRDQQSKELDEKVTKVRRRNINLKAWAEGDEIVDEDELDEDTRLTAKMMELYGNSMDLLA